MKPKTLRKRYKDDMKWLKLASKRFGLWKGRRRNKGRVNAIHEELSTLHNCVK